MTGVVLAGGNGTRLRPMTEIVNKHLLPVYDKPMIEYPIRTLKKMGCTRIVLVTGGENIGGFANYLGTGERLGVDIVYRVQAEANGIAGALKCVKGLVSGYFPVILGDNYFASTPSHYKRPTLFIKPMAKGANRFGVFDQDKFKITEKPKQDSGYVVTGLYIYDEALFNIIDSLKPSKRGELEITDVNNYYLETCSITTVVDYDSFWSDMGNPDSLLETANYIKDISE